MDQVEYRSVIHYYFLKGKTNQVIKRKLDSVYGNLSPSFATIKRWTAEFRRGRTSVHDEPRSGRPNEVTTQENIDKIQNIVMANPKIKLSEIVDILNMSKERVGNILHEHLHMKKLSARWVPRSLTIDQKWQRVRDSKACLELFKRNSAEFIRRYITVDETWIHHFNPESNQQAKEWVEAGGSAPKRPKTQTTAGKVMATVFWDSKGIILIDYLQKGKTITGEYYATLLDQLMAKIAEIRPHLQRKKILFHHDNAPAHSSMKAMAKLNELNFQLLPHPPYSPDLAPCDFYLFPNLKRYLRGKRFASNDEVQSETEGYFAELPKSYYLKGIKKLENRWTRCIELKGDYIEE